jgi:tRNA-dihydrouridine synthase B
MAPMSGCTDLSFRLIAREHGARFCFYEMIDSNSLVYSPKTDVDILKTNAKDTPIAAQLVGSDLDIMEKAAKKLFDIVKIKFLDINAACPVKKIIKKKAGSYFLKDPQGLYKIIKELSSILSIPVTVKLRTGYHARDLKTLINIAKNCQKNGAAALFVHGRTQKQGYSGDIDYEAIKAVKHALKIPVFGSGNIMNPQMAKKMFDLTDCDGITVARGALGNPWIFKNIETYLKNNQAAQHIPIEERIKTLKKHLSYIYKYKEIHPSSKVGYMRKVSLWYLKDFPNACRTRGMVNPMQSYQELLKLLDSIAGSS